MHCNRTYDFFPAKTLCDDFPEFFESSIVATLWNWFKCVENSLILFRCSFGNSAMLCAKLSLPVLP